MKNRSPVLILLGALALILLVGVLAAACGGSTATTTTAVTTPATTATTAGTSTTAGATTTAPSTATTAAGGGATSQVTLQNLQITPATVTIKAGDTVTWTNNDSTTHHLVGDNGEFDSGDMTPGSTFSFKFATAGTVAYHCSIHPSMTGTITVQ
jgi:plastocyanin